MLTDDFIKELDEIVQAWKEEMYPVAINTSMVQGLANISSRYPLSCTFANILINHELIRKE